jgi:hypothetical protein
MLSKILVCALSFTAVTAQEVDHGKISQNLAVKAVQEFKAVRARTNVAKTLIEETDWSMCVECKWRANNKRRQIATLARKN